MFRAFFFLNFFFLEARLQLEDTTSLLRVLLVDDRSLVKGISVLLFDVIFRDNLLMSATNRSLILLAADSISAALEWCVARLLRS